MLVEGDGNCDSGIPHSDYNAFMGGVDLGSRCETSKVDGGNTNNTTPKEQVSISLFAPLWCQNQLMEDFLFFLRDCVFLYTNTINPKEKRISRGC